MVGETFKLPSDTALPTAASNDSFALPSETPVATGVVPAAPSATEALGRGAAQGLSAGFADELQGLAEAGGAKPDDPNTWGLGHVIYGAYKYLRNNPDAVKLYDTAVARERKANEAAAVAHPAMSTTGQVAGSVAAMLATAPAAAATWGARALQAARVGATYGAVAGAGTGEGTEGKLIGAGTGAVAGGLTGLVAAPAAEGVGAAVGALGSKVTNAFRSAFDPDGEAARRIIIAAQRGLTAQGPALTAPETAAANTAGIPRALVDVGGQPTLALARSAANTSPEARAALQDFTQERFVSQAPRAAAFVDQLVGGAGDVGATREALQTAARAANKPAYETAYQAGSGGLWSSELERLAGSPAVVEAMKGAAENGKTRAIADGFGAFNPGVMVTQDGRLVFNRTPTGVPTYPDLQFWDYTYRNLRDAGQAAIRAGRNSEGGAISNVASALRNELDSLVPQYQAARQGAAAFFGADDALQAGANFVTQRMSNADAQRAVDAMSPAERQLFMQGYASRLIDRIKEAADNRNVANVFGNSPADRQRAVIALGAPRANQLEAYLRAERILDAARGAVQGNSTTARQLAEIGLAGGAGYGLGTQGDMTHPTPQGLLGAALAYGALRGKIAINQGLSQRVGQMLTSNDPAILRRGFEILGRNDSILKALRAFDTASGTAVGTTTVGKMLQAPSTAYGQGNDQGVPRPPAQ